MLNKLINLCKYMIQCSYQPYLLYCYLNQQTEEHELGEARDGAHQAGGRSRDIRAVADRRRRLAVNGGPY